MRFFSEFESGPICVLIRPRSLSIINTCYVHEYLRTNRFQEHVFFPVAASPCSRSRFPPETGRENPGKNCSCRALHIIQRKNKPSGQSNCREKLIKLWSKRHRVTLVQADIWNSSLKKYVRNLFLKNHSLTVILSKYRLTNTRVRYWNSLKRICPDNITKL